MTLYRSFLRPFLIGAAVGAILIGCILLVGTVQGAPSASKHTKRTCIPERVWEDTPGLRPCARIVRVYEDGSIELSVSDANGTERYSIGVGVPDWYECQTGRAPAACYG